MRNLCALAAVLLLAASGPAAAADGEAIFNDICSACHQPDGSGQPGLAPPLVDAALWSRLGGKAPGYVVGVVLAGLTGTIEAAGQSYIGLVMPTHDFMSDEEIAAVTNYVLQDLNQVGTPIDATTVGDVRAAVPTHKQLRDIRKGGS
jgi:mono/diheme cytochrome c family protein